MVTLAHTMISNVKSPGTVISEVNILVTVICCHVQGQNPWYSQFKVQNPFYNHIQSYHSFGSDSKLNNVGTVIAKAKILVTVIM